MSDPITHAIADIRLALGNLRDDMSEVRDRARRTETRLTRYLETRGFDPKVTRPRFDQGTNTVHLPSPECSLREVIDAVPPLLRSKVMAVNLMVGSDLIGTLTIPTT
jgi:hypothetical protein